MMMLSKCVRDVALKATSLVLVGAASALIVSCTEDIPTAPKQQEAAKAAGFKKSSVVAAVFCTADVASRSVSCSQLGKPELPPLPTNPGAKQDLIIGRQNVYVTLESQNVNYNSGTGAFTFDVTVRNLIPQPLGTADANTLAPDPAGVRVFFASGPTVVSGTGAITVAGDGVGAFTDANQPYYQYNTVLEQFEVSAPKTWQLNMPSSVASFNFELLVSAEVPFPNGYIDLQVGTNNSVRPPDLRQITYFVRNANGEIIPNPGPLLFMSSSTNTAAVDNGGMLTPLRAGATTITASTTDGVIVGVMQVTVQPIRRTWTGAVDTHWETGGNWIPVNIEPGPTDTAVIPNTVTNFPALFQNQSIGGVEIGVSPARVEIGAFDLNASGDVVMDTGGAINGTVGRLILSGTARTVNGIAPRVRVTGTYSLSANLNVDHNLRVEAGRLRNSLFRIRVNNP